jgi:ankyrin repeat protein
MEFVPLPFRASSSQYEEQARQLLEAWRSGDPGAVRVFRTRHPRFLDPETPWLPKRIADAEATREPIDIADARLASARCYDFLDWPHLTRHADSVNESDSPAARFESAVEAVISGDITTLGSLLRGHPGLARARSTRVTHFDPPVHGATLLHYVAANGVESYRQRTPPNAVDVAETLLEAGADVDALAGMYGGQHTTMSMLVSSSPPAEAGVQVALIDTLVEAGASVEPRGTGAWSSPLMTALAFGFTDAAAVLVRHGARVETLPVAAGLGRLDVARHWLAGATGEERHRALALAAQQGHVDILRLLLDAGEDPDRYNPEGHHSHSTPLHQAVSSGRDAVVRLLVERGARLDIRDRIYDSTPLEWAVHCARTDIAAYLRGQSR